MEYFFDEIESCEEVGAFENEYVYDIEIDDNTHTFITNDVLVHNSLFVSFKPAIEHSDWKNIIVNNIDKITNTFIILDHTNSVSTSNVNCLGIVHNLPDLISILKSNDPHTLVMDGHFIKDRELKNIDISKYKILWNWSNELDFIHGIDYFRFGSYFKKSLDEYAEKFGVENKEDFELERVSESIINIAKKKYIQHIVYEDGIPYERLNYLYPKGVELVRSSTPLFARDKIMDIIKYLFSKPDSFNIKELLKIVKDLKREFDLCIPDRIDEISMQSSCSNYNEKVLNDKDKLEFVTGTHFAVKAAAYHNFLLHKNPSLNEKYEYIKSGNKIKYYYCKDNSVNDIFAYTRGSYPIEIAPEIDLNTQFMKCILSPINSIIEPLGMPEITSRLRVLAGIMNF